jgi:plastocyanin
VIPGIAAGSSAPGTASFTAIDFAWQANGGPGTKATIAQGGTVAFSYPTGISEHNADFGQGPQPTSCAQTAGPGSGRVPPLPHQATSAGWTGTCTFNAPGTYTFHCDVHPFMTGTVVVEGSGSTTGAGTGTTTTTGGAPLAGQPSRAISVAARQRGATVHGSVKLAKAAAGGRLEVDLRASARSLGLRGTGPVLVGRLTITGLKPGTKRFAVSLDAAARRALRRHGRLELSVEVLVRSPSGRSVSVIRRVLLLA